MEPATTTPGSPGAAFGVVSPGRNSRAVLAALFLVLCATLWPASPAAAASAEPRAGGPARADARSSAGAPRPAAGKRLAPAAAPAKRREAGTSVARSRQVPGTRSGARAPTRAGLPASAHPAALAAARPARPPAVPLATRNVAVAADAVPMAPKALLSQGCLDGVHGAWLARRLAGVEDGAVPEPGQAAPGCVQFASVLTGNRQIEALAWVPAMTQAPGAAWQAPALVVDQRGPANVLRRLEPFAPRSDRVEVWMPAAALLSGDWPETVPPRWQREVLVLVRQMKRQSGADDSALARLVLDDTTDGAQVAAVELVDATGEVIDTALWLDRDNGPGGFVSASGGDHERMLWQMPVDYRRISRGVGRAVVQVRQRVLAPASFAGARPRYVIRNFRSHREHQGIDFAAPSGTPVVTVADGVVVMAGWNGGYGNLVVVDHGGGITTYYAHLSGYAGGIQEGAVVQRGQEIGQVGSTGRSTGPHLHFEIRRDGRYLDPANPQHSLPNWELAPGEHDAALARLLTLSMTRRDGFAGAMRDASPERPRGIVRVTMGRRADPAASGDAD